MCLTRITHPSLRRARLCHGTLAARGQLRHASTWRRRVSRASHRSCAPERIARFSRALHLRVRAADGQVCISPPRRSLVRCIGVTVIDIVVASHMPFIDWLQGPPAGLAGCIYWRHVIFRIRDARAWEKRGQRLVLFAGP